MRQALTYPQVALVGQEISRHDSWEEAVEHCCKALGCSRDAAWFRYTLGGMALFDTTLPWPARQQPIARILNPEEYQAAKSRGDLADEAAADLYFRRAGAWNSDPASTQTQVIDTMKKPANDPQAKPLKLTYFVVKRIVWRASVLVPESTIDLTEKEASSSQVRGWVLRKMLRLATEEEKNAPAKPPGDTTDRREVSVAVPNQAAAVPVQPVALAKIRPDPTQPRKDFSPESMQEIVDSIKVQGVMQPILVRPMSRWRQIVAFVAREWARIERKEPNRELFSTDLWAAGIDVTAKEMLVAEGRIERHGAGFRPTAGALAPPTGDRSLAGESEWLEIVYGERRWRGAQAAGLTEIPAQVWELSDVDAAEKQACENLDRDALKPLEEAHQYRKLLDQPGYTMARVVETTGKARNTIYGKLKLLDLPDEARKAVAGGVLPAVTAERLARLEPRTQAAAVKRVLHAERYELEDGKKVPSDRQCQQIIAKVEAQVACEVRWETAQAEAEKNGVKLLSAKEAAEEETYNDNGNARYGSKYVKASQPCELHPQNWSWSKVLGKGVKDVTKYLGRDTKGNGHVWMLKADAEAKAKELGIKLAKASSSSSSGGSRMSAGEKARAAAERKKKQLQAQAEDAGLAEIVAAIERTDVGRLPVEFWRELAMSLGKDSCWDCTRRVERRRGIKKVARGDESLPNLARGSELRPALALLTEIVTVGVRGSWNMGKNITRMRVALGLAKASEIPADEDDEEESASARTDRETEQEDAEEIEEATI